MIQNLSNNVIIPIAGMIITFVLCYELITTITEKNNMHDVDTFIFFKYVFKACVAVFLLSHTFEITIAIFDVGQWVVNQAATSITNDTYVDVLSMYNSFRDTLDGMDSYVTNSGAGEGLIFYGNVIIPFVDKFPKDTQLYKIMTTKPEEQEEN